MHNVLDLNGYWGPRPESAERCAERLELHLRALGAVDARFNSWWATGYSRKSAKARPIDTTREGLTTLILNGRSYTDRPEQKLMAELGYSVNFWNGESDEIGYSLKCGKDELAQRVPNNILMQLPLISGEAAYLYEPPYVANLTAALATTWDPEWATWIDADLRKLQDPAPREIHVGVHTYISKLFTAVERRLPREVKVEPLVDGQLLSITKRIDEITSDDLKSIRAAIVPR